MAKGTLLATVPSSSNPDKTYEVRLGRDNVVYCSCPAWRFSRNKPRDCKHLVQFRAAVARRAA